MYSLYATYCPQLDCSCLVLTWRHCKPAHARKPKKPRSPYACVPHGEPTATPRRLRAPLRPVFTPTTVIESFLCHRVVSNMGSATPSRLPTERTPLLAAESDAADTEAIVKNTDKPLPKAQLLLLCLARLVEPVAFFSIFPFLNQMIYEVRSISEHHEIILG
jgi:hypothetical protein